MELGECGWNRYPERWWDLHPWSFSGLTEMADLISVGCSPALSGRLGERPPTNTSVMWEHGETHSGRVSQPHLGVISRFPNGKQLGLRERALMSVLSESALGKGKCRPGRGN